MKAINQLLRTLSLRTRRAFLKSLSLTTAILLLILLAGTGTILFGYHMLDVVNGQKEVTTVVIKPREPKPLPKVYVPPAKIEFPIY